MKPLTTLLLLIHTGATALACGPWIPEAFVIRNDELFYAPPEVGFSAEVRHLIPESVPHQAIFETAEVERQTAQQELSAALKNSVLDPAAQLGALEAFTEFRNQIDRINPYLDTQPFAYYRPAVDDQKRREHLETLAQLTVPEDLPQEFSHYLEGALAYYRGDLESARAHWQQVLELPATQRHYRSVTAAFMLAKTAPKFDRAAFEKVRALASAGFADTLGLAAASYGLQARAYLDRYQYGKAIELYLQQGRSGYRNAMLSLEIVAREAWQNTGEFHLPALAKETNTRAVMTAYLLNHPNQPHIDRWLKALPDSKELTVSEAGRFALMEYQQNNLTACRLWLDYAAPDDALALWVRSKLYLRTGRLDEGRTLMLAMTQQMQHQSPTNWHHLDTQKAWAELGLLQLREKRYLEAADAFYNSGSWQDTAYILDRILSTDELLHWLQQRTFPEPVVSNYHNNDPRELTARRLMREHRFEEALTYFSEENKATATRYLEAMRLASDEATATEVRAQHYWTAARLLRDHGMQLLASELAPDHAWLSGDYDWNNLAEARQQQRYADSYSINRTSRDESKRVTASRIHPEKRFHYRYRAVDLATIAAGLLPNNHEDAARIYCIAGNWIKLRDPQAADLLYKQLVIRCPQTELGQAAQQARWFPSIDLSTIEPFSSDKDV